MSIESNYHNRVSRQSDINEHLPVLYKYSKECKTIIEMGVRNCVSTYAFLYAMPESFICYDIDRSPEVDIAERLCKAEKQDFHFKLESTLECLIEPTDLLFIDTRHTAGQLQAELKRHANKVKKYIIMHDTVSYGEVGEENEPGLNLAISQFLEYNKSEWKIKERFMNNNGLTVLERIQ